MACVLLVVASDVFLIAGIVVFRVAVGFRDGVELEVDGDAVVVLLELHHLEVWTSRHSPLPV